MESANSRSLRSFSVTDGTGMGTPGTLTPLCAPTAPPIHARKRVRGLSFVATDLDWRRGTGPAVEGSGEALLMAIAGRTAALPELSGPGVQAFAARMG